MVAESVGRVVVHVDDAQLRRAFQNLQAEVVAAGIEAGWWALKKRMQISYNVELQALSRAIGRAEWLAMG